MIWMPDKDRSSKDYQHESPNCHLSAGYPSPSSTNQFYGLVNIVVKCRALFVLLLLLDA